MASSTRRILFTLSGLVTIGVAIALLYSSFVPGTDHLDSFGLPHASPYVDANQDMLVAPPLQVVRSTNPSRFAASISIALQGGGSGDSQENEYLSSRVVIRGRSSAVCTTLRMLKGAWCGELDSDEYSVVGVDTTTSVPVLVSAPLITPGAPDATILLAVRNEWSLYVRDTATRSDLSGVWLAALDPTDPHSEQLLSRRLWTAPVAAQYVALSKQSSPVSIPERLSRGVFVVGADGYEPAVFKRNPFQATVEIELHKAGYLDLLLSDELQRRIGAVTTAKEGVESAYCQLALRAGGVPGDRIALDQLGRQPMALGPGEYELSIEIARGDAVRVLAQQSFRIVSGDTSTVRLNLISSTESAGALEGHGISEVVVLASLPKQSREYCKVRLSGRGDKSSIRLVKTLEPLRTDPDDGAGVCLFESIPAGEYDVTLLPLNHSLPCVVDYRKQEPVIFEASDAAIVDVATTVASSDVMGLSHLRWGYADGGDALKSFVELRNGSAVLVCDPRLIRLQAVGDSCASEIVEVQPRPGERSKHVLTASADRIAALKLCAWSLGSHSMVEPEFWQTVQITPLVGAGGLVFRRYGILGTGARYGDRLVEPDWAQSVLLISPPGRYRIHIPGLLDVERDLNPGLNEQDFVLQ